MKTATYELTQHANGNLLIVNRHEPHKEPVAVTGGGALKLGQRIVRALNRNPDDLFIGDEVRPTDPFGPRIYANVHSKKGHFVVDVTTHCHVSRGCVGKECQDGRMFLEQDIVPLAVDWAMRDKGAEPSDFIRGGIGNVPYTKEEYDAWQAERSARPLMD